MAEKVGLANIFHTSGLEIVARPNFSTCSTNFCGSLINHENGGASWPGQHFPHFGLGQRGQANEFLWRSYKSHEFLWKFFFNHENCGKSWPGQHFPHFGLGQRGQANFFHLFHEFLWKSCKSRKWWSTLAGQHFPHFGPRQHGQANEFLWKSYKSLKWWNKLAWPTFSTLRAWKSWPGQLFPLVPRISVEVL